MTSADSLQQIEPSLTPLCTPTAQGDVSTLRESPLCLL